MTCKSIKAALLLLAVAELASLIEPSLAFAHNLVVRNLTGHSINLGQFRRSTENEYQLVLDNYEPMDNGEIHVFTYGNGDAGVLGLVGPNAALAPFSTRLEYFADEFGRSSNNISYVVGRNLSMVLDDGHGKRLGDLRSIVAGAPGNIIQYGEGWRPVIIGYYDGSTQDQRDAANYMYRMLPCAGGYIEPDDDHFTICNPMIMALDSSNDYYIDIGNP
jgi:hypothetical protein